MKNSAIDQNELPPSEPVFETGVPGLAKIAAELRRLFPLLTPEAVARILRAPVRDCRLETKPNAIPASQNVRNE